MIPGPAGAIYLSGEIYLFETKQRRECSLQQGMRMLVADCMSWISVLEGISVLRVTVYTRFRSEPMHDGL